MEKLEAGRWECSAYCMYSHTHANNKWLDMEASAKRNTKCETQKRPPTKKRNTFIRIAVGSP